MIKQHDIITVAITIDMKKTLEILGISDDKTFIGFRTINITHFTSSPACHYFEERSANHGSIVKLATTSTNIPRESPNSSYYSNVKDSKPNEKWGSCRMHDERHTVIAKYIHDLDFDMYCDHSIRLIVSSIYWLKSILTNNNNNYQLYKIHMFG